MTTQFSLPLDPSVVLSVAQQTGLSSNTIGTLGDSTPYVDPAYTQANTALVKANASFVLANTTAVKTQSVYDYANTISAGAAIDAIARANTVAIQGVNTVQNTTITIIQGVDSGQNARIVVVEGTDLSQNVRLDYSNTAINIIQGTDTTQNTRLTVIEGTDTTQNTRLTVIEGTDTFQNTRMTIIEGTDTSQNTRMTIIEGTDVTQNTAISSTNGKMESAYNRANTGTVLAQASFDYANSRQNIQTTASPTFNSLTLTNPLAITQGGTGTTSASQALTNLLPTGTTSGYVLTTGGPGTFYWAAGGGGGSGATPGTTINSTRLSYTANGSGLSYTTPTYTPGASQLRVYFDGLRQFASEYTETSSTICTFGTSPASGVVILFEVDGYINNPYYANNITFTAPFGSIVSTANTIQLAIQDLESRKATLVSPALTGVPTAPTAAANTSNTQIATTSFVNSTISANVTPAIAAAIAAALPTGVITMWSGSIASIPSGWYLCNGTNGTPDLRDRFVVGAGSTYSVAATGGSADAVVVSHTHTATSTVTDPGHTHGLSNINARVGVTGGPTGGVFSDGGTFTTNSATTGITIGTSINSTGVSGTNANLPPYYALAFIMKA